MSEVRPFAGLRYARALGPRLAGPYDVISPPEREQLAREPENIVHLTLPPGPEGEREYGGAAATLELWLREGVLLRDSDARIYVLEEHTSEGRVRRGFFALLRLADYSEGVVLPHEDTMPGPKLDRLRLTRCVRANLEPLFFIYEDRDSKLEVVLDRARSAPALARDRGPDGTDLALFALSAPDAIAAVRDFLARAPVIIADGHHRYESMLEYRDECRRESGDDPEAPSEFVLAYLVNALDPGSVIRPIHRVLRGEAIDPGPALTARGFQTHELPSSLDADEVLRELAARASSEHAFAFVSPARGVLLATRPRGQRLDVEVLHEEILSELEGPLTFDAQPARVLAAIRDGGASLAVLLNPVDPERLFSVVQSGARLPRKSTFFTPKVPSGLLLRDFR